MEKINLNINKTNTVKVKIFEFEIYNYTMFATESEKNYEWYDKLHDKLMSPQDIENSINEFLNGKEFLDMKINYYTIYDEHNLEARANKVTYTILYK